MVTVTTEQSSRIYALLRELAARVDGNNTFTRKEEGHADGDAV